MTGRTNGPSVVALGGGHGLSVTLRAVSRYAGDVTAVVSGADDGGSSGRLRAWWSGPAPGDLRRCLLALAGDSADQQMWAKVLDYRFGEGELAGHSLGNLVVLGLAETLGDLGRAADELGRLLGVSARVLPACAEAVQLRAEALGPGGSVFEVAGQAKIAHCEGKLARVWVEPPDPEVPAVVLEAIRSADQVVLGPGSLYTSVLAVCSVPAVRQALAERKGGRIYVCNLDYQIPETAGLDAQAHLDALAAHGVAFDTIVCDPATPVGAPAARALPQEPAAQVAVVRADLSSPDGRSHDPALLSKVLAGLALSP
ncbi:MAG TPA: gluconeogenesis factor YvcK family protein [Acidimicrobiales bacterium]|nr:gluconeogenesis factor YvcK family protein [Acidimicrobiales bacterium]